MRILVLTLILSFLSHSAFGAAEAKPIISYERNVLPTQEDLRDYLKKEQERIEESFGEINIKLEQGIKGTVLSETLSKILEQQDLSFHDRYLWSYSMVSGFTALVTKMQTSLKEKAKEKLDIQDQDLNLIIWLISLQDINAVLHHNDLERHIATNYYYLTAEQQNKFTKILQELKGDESFFSEYIDYNNYLSILHQGFDTLLRRSVLPIVEIGVKLAKLHCCFLVCLLDKTTVMFSQFTQPIILKLLEEDAITSLYYKHLLHMQARKNSLYTGDTSNHRSEETFSQLIEKMPIDGEKITAEIAKATEQLKYAKVIIYTQEVTVKNHPIKKWLLAIANEMGKQLLFVTSQQSQDIDSEYTNIISIASLNPKEIAALMDNVHNEYKIDIMHSGAIFKPIMYENTSFSMIKTCKLIESPTYEWPSSPTPTGSSLFLNYSTPQDGGPPQLEVYIEPQFKIGNRQEFMSKIPFVKERGPLKVGVISDIVKLTPEFVAQINSLVSKDQYNIEIIIYCCGSLDFASFDLFMKNILALSPKINVSPKQQAQKYQEWIESKDIFIDPTPYGMHTCAMDVFSAGRPIVCLYDETKLQSCYAASIQAQLLPSEISNLFVQNQSSIKLEEILENIYLKIQQDWKRVYEQIHIAITTSGNHPLISPKQRALWLQQTLSNQHGDEFELQQAQKTKIEASRLPSIVLFLQSHFLHELSFIACKREDYLDIIVKVKNSLEEEAISESILINFGMFSSQGNIFYMRGVNHMPNETTTSPANQIREQLRQ
jgi:hypothetical protein